MTAAQQFHIIAIFIGLGPWPVTTAKKHGVSVSLIGSARFLSSKLSPLQKTIMSLEFSNDCIVQYISISLMISCTSLGCYLR